MLINDELLPTGSLHEAHDIVIREGCPLVQWWQHGQAPLRLCVCETSPQSHQDGPYITLLYWGDIMDSWKQEMQGLQIDPSIPVINHIIFIFKHHSKFIYGWLSVSIAVMKKLMWWDSLDLLK